MGGIVNNVYDSLGIYWINVIIIKYIRVNREQYKEDFKMENVQILSIQSKVLLKPTEYFQVIY